MTPAEAEFDVTDDVQVSALLAGHEGPVRTNPVLVAEQPEPDAFVISMDVLRTSSGS